MFLLLLFFRKREEGREGRRKREIDVREKNPSITSMHKDGAHNIRMCHDWEWNLKTLGVHENIPTH